MTISKAMQDPEVRDLTIELAAVAGRLVAMCATKGIAVTREQLVDSVLSAIEDDQATAPAGVASLAKARRARGMPVLARPIELAQPVEQMNVSFTFHGDRARQIGEMAVLLHGESREETCRHVVTAATERGLASLKRELGID